MYACFLSKWFVLHIDLYMNGSILKTCSHNNDYQKQEIRQMQTFRDKEILNRISQVSSPNKYTNSSFTFNLKPLLSWFKNTWERESLGIVTISALWCMWQYEKIFNSKNIWEAFGFHGVENRTLWLIILCGW